ncbi:MAG: NADPH-dependent assimilatory sulfite reductase hemoprotein subunit [Alicyclobacillus sp.]|nr:NADPH-dependent assimilatory sulfite reductase hemoprotein subunit [Alicyclobacillus sp.]
MDSAHGSSGQHSKVEKIKEASRYLRGTIAEALEDGTSHFGEENVQVLKFHGVYQQDDRDLRRQLTREGKERHYMMMVRARIPGGVLTANQYLQFDRISDAYGSGSLRITTRQTFQMHGVLKANLKATIRGLHDALVTTLGGCGDQVRNIVGCAAPHEGPFYEAVRADLLRLVDAFSAKTNAYHEIWLDGERIALGDGEPNEEPLYGKTYLPRKFKLCVVYEGDNCADVYSNDIGMVAHRDGDTVAGYTLVVGGGMGRTASDAKTPPALAQPLCFVAPHDLVATCRAIVEVQRDYGNRENRKFARMKYLIEERGLEWFSAQVAARVGKPLTPPRELVWHTSHDHLGRIAGGDGRVHVGVYVENGRIRDTHELPLKSILRDIVAEFRPGVRLTTQQNLILTGLTPEEANLVERRLRDAGVPLAHEQMPVRLLAMACPAMPTCGLAIAESERVFPSVVRELERVLRELDLADEPISVRMTGCPNGCARPYIAEIGFVGRVLGKYDVFLGANQAGTRMNQLYKSQVPLEELVSTIRPLLRAFRAERQPGESFGDYCARIGVDALEAHVSAWV